MPRKSARLAITPKKTKKIKVTKQKHGRNQDFIRCICGNTHPDGNRGENTAFIAFIMCDGCNCWQHNECMGVTTNAKKVRKLVYFCEKCRPKDHKVLLHNTAVSNVEQLSKRENVESHIWDVIVEEPVKRFWNVYRTFCVGQPKPDMPATGLKQEIENAQKDTVMEDSPFTPDPLRQADDALASAQLQLEAETAARTCYDCSIDQGLKLTFSALSNEQLHKLLESLQAVRGNQRNIRNRLRDLVQELVDQKKVRETGVGILREVFQWERPETVPNRARSSRTKRQLER